MRRTLGLTEPPHLIALTSEIGEFLDHSERSQYGAKADGHCGFESAGVQVGKDVKSTRAFIEVSVGGRYMHPLCTRACECT